MRANDDLPRCYLPASENAPSKCPARAAFQRAAERAVDPPAQCPLMNWIQTLIEKALEEERNRVAAEEAADWESCFGNNAPADPELKLAKIVLVGSTRALLSIINSPASV